MASARDRQEFWQDLRQPRSRWHSVKLSDYKFRNIWHRKQENMALTLTHWRRLLRSDLQMIAVKAKWWNKKGDRDNGRDEEPCTIWATHLRRWWKCSPHAGLEFGQGNQNFKIYIADTYKHVDNKVSLLNDSKTCQLQCLDRYHHPPWCLYGYIIFYGVFWLDERPSTSSKLKVFAHHCWPQNLDENLWKTWRQMRHREKRS